ncbi:hypothetical protein D9M68_885590 [compost metagenome]
MFGTGPDVVRSKGMFIEGEIPCSLEFSSKAATDLIQPEKSLAMRLARHEGKQ